MNYEEYYFGYNDYCKQKITVKNKKESFPWEADAVIADLKERCREAETEAAHLNAALRETRQKMNEIIQALGIMEKDHKKAIEQKTEEVEKFVKKADKAKEELVRLKAKLFDLEEENKAVKAYNEQLRSEGATRELDI
jgi:chromosome segregation ATPase